MNAQQYLEHWEQGERKEHSPLQPQHNGGRVPRRKLADTLATPNDKLNHGGE